MKFQLQKFTLLLTGVKWMIATSLVIVLSSKEFEIRLHKQAFAGPILNFMPVDTGCNKKNNLPLIEAFCILTVPAQYGYNAALLSTACCTTL